MPMNVECLNVGSALARETDRCGREHASGGWVSRVSHAFCSSRIERNFDKTGKLDKERQAKVDRNNDDSFD